MGMTREFVVAADVDDYDQIILSLAAQEVQTGKRWQQRLLAAVVVSRVNQITPCPLAARPPSTGTACGSFKRKASYCTYASSAPIGAACWCSTGLTRALYPSVNLAR